MKWTTKNALEPITLEYIIILENNHNINQIPMSYLKNIRYYTNLMWYDSMSYDSQGKNLTNPIPIDKNYHRG